MVNLRVAASGHPSDVRFVFVIDPSIIVNASFSVIDFLSIFTGVRRICDRWAKSAMTSWGIYAGLYPI